MIVTVCFTVKPSRTARTSVLPFRFDSWNGNLCLLSRLARASHNQLLEVCWVPVPVGVRIISGEQLRSTSWEVSIRISVCVRHGHCIHHCLCTRLKRLLQLMMIWLKLMICCRKTIGRNVSVLHDVTVSQWWHNLCLWFILLVVDVHIGGARWVGLALHGRWRQVPLFGSSWCRPAANIFGTTG